MSADEEEEIITDESEFHVEKVVGMRFAKDGSREFLIKWRGWPDSDNTWEPQANIYAVNLVEDYLKEREKEKESKKKVTKRPAKATPEDRPRGFERNLTPEKIFGAFQDSNNEMMFIMKWKNDDDADIVPASEANLKCPHVVIQFYEDRITWHANPLLGDDA